MRFPAIFISGACPEAPFCGGICGVLWRGRSCGIASPQTQSLARSRKIFQVLDRDRWLVQVVELNYGHGEAVPPPSLISTHAISRMANELPSRRNPRYSTSRRSISGRIDTASSFCTDRPTAAVPAGCRPHRPASIASPDGRRWLPVHCIRADAA